MPIMDNWSLQKKNNGEWHEYYLLKDGQSVAYAKWRIVDGHAELHNSAENTSKSLLIKTREIFNHEIKSDMRAKGVDVVVVCDLLNNVDRIRRHYWRFMGFDYFCETQGYACAVMEV